MASRNDVTGDLIKTGTGSDAYKDGWERIFGKKEKNVSDDGASKLISLLQEAATYAKGEVLSDIERIIEKVSATD